MNTDEILALQEKLDEWKRKSEDQYNEFMQKQYEFTVNQRKNESLSARINRRGEQLKKKAIAERYM